MAKELPPLHLVQDRTGPLFEFEDRRAFSDDLWVPTLTGIEEACTVGEQREALNTAIVSVGASSRGLDPFADSRARYYGPQLDARFRMSEGHPDLSFVRFDTITTQELIAVGYQMADEKTPNPAFAVFDVDKMDNLRTYHNVVRDPNEELGSIERSLGRGVMRSLAVTLNNRYPGFEIHDKLAAALNS